MDKILDEQKIRKIVKDEMDKNYNSGNPRIPPHTHDGNNALQINQKDVIASVAFLAFITASSGTFTLKLGSKPTMITFNGFAANNAGGGAATKRAVINGVAQLGKSYQLLGQSDVNVTNVLEPLVQTSSYMYIDQTDILNTRVGSSPLYLAYGASPLAAESVSLEITSFDNQSISGNVVLSSGWQITGGLIIN